MTHASDCVCLYVCVSVVCIIVPHCLLRQSKRFLIHLLLFFLAVAQLTIGFILLKFTIKSKLSTDCP